MVDSSSPSPMTHKAWTDMRGSESGSLWLVVMVMVGLAQASEDMAAASMNKSAEVVNSPRPLQANKVNLQRLSEAHFEFSINLFRQKALLQAFCNQYSFLKTYYKCSI